jgi:hypothetical protein
MSTFSLLQREAIADTPIVRPGELRQHPSVTDFVYRVIHTLDLDVALVETLRVKGSSAPYPSDAAEKIVHIDSLITYPKFTGSLEEAVTL